MLEELDRASKQLCAALERYLQICAGIRDLYLQGATSRHVPPEYAQKVDREVGLVESYNSKITQAKQAIKATRNYAFKIAPINSLPLEILTCIFHMVHDADPCHANRLALVCTCWRSAALGSHSLWSHIDYRPHISKWFYPELLTRAKLYLARSGETPIDFHLSGQSETYNNNCYDTPVEGLCELIAPRLQSLNLDLEGYFQDWMDDNPHSVISALLSHCEPGTLTKLVIMDPDRFGFITTTEDGHAPASALKVSSEHAKLDKIFSSITVLHLTGVFP